MRIPTQSKTINRSLTALCLGISFACGGGGGGASTDTTLESSGLETGTGTFVDAPVSGLEYISGDLTGITDEEGRFTYEVGEKIRFKLAGLEIGEVEAGEDIVTPADIRTDDPEGDHEELTNLIRLLQSLDEDGDPDNGIELPENLRQSTELADVELRRPKESFESDSRVRLAIEGRGGNLVSRVDAWTHFQEQTDRLPERRNGPQREIQAPEDLREELRDRISELSTPIVDTAQKYSYDAGGNNISTSSNTELFGQDANYKGLQPNIVDHKDGTATDLITGLMWQTSPGTKVNYREGIAKAETEDTAGYDDWRLPTIKELYSLMRFDGVTGIDSDSSKPYLNHRVFDFHYGDETGERFIDAQYLSSTTYVSTTMEGEETVFGVNFADGRIKGYPQTKDFYAMMVRGREGYGENKFSANVDGTVHDDATGLTWMQDDSGSHMAGPRFDGMMNWNEALKWVENLEFAGHDDWRLPNAKELQSIIDYTRSPSTTDSAAIDSVFGSTAITDEEGSRNFGFYWTGTSHLDGLEPGSSAIYICFGEALGFMNGSEGELRLLDVHGAGAQRSDPKTGNPSDYPFGHGPQGDVIRIYNLVRPVRGGFARPIEVRKDQKHQGRKEARANLDVNGDGLISREEFIAIAPEGESDRAAAHFEELDINGDGVIDEGEKPVRENEEDDREGALDDQLNIERMGIESRTNPDTNGDGVVSREEFVLGAPEGESDRAAEHFDELDTNGDGVIDESERPERNSDRAEAI
jgi:hypothetical protein